MSAANVRREVARSASDLHEDAPGAGPTAPGAVAGLWQTAVGTKKPRRISSTGLVPYVFALYLLRLLFEKTGLSTFPMTVRQGTDRNVNDRASLVTREEAKDIAVNTP